MFEEKRFLVCSFQHSWYVTSIITYFRGIVLIVCIISWVFLWFLSSQSESCVLILQRNNLSPFLSYIGWKSHWATRLDFWIEVRNSLKISPTWGCIMGVLTWNLVWFSCYHGMFMYILLISICSQPKNGFHCDALCFPLVFFINSSWQTWK
jgi:hypothetical protein